MRARRASERLFTYGARGNPTAFALEDMVTELEGGYRTRLFPSGPAAAAMTLLARLRPGEHVLLPDCVYEPVRNGRRLPARAWRDGRLLCRRRQRPRAPPAPETRLVYVEAPGSLAYGCATCPPSPHWRTRTARWWRPTTPGVRACCTSRSRWGRYLADGRHQVPGRPFRRDDGHRLHHRGRLAAAGRAGRRLRHGGQRRRCLRCSAACARWARVWPSTEPARWRWRSGCRRGPRWRACTARRCPATPATRCGGATAAAPTACCRSRCAAAAAAAERFVDSLSLFGIGASWGGFEPGHGGRHGRARSVGDWSGSTPLVRLHIGLEGVEDLITDTARGFAALGDGVPHAPCVPQRSSAGAVPAACMENEDGHHR